MSTIVLVHGAWQTRATWDLVVPRLREAGHAVHVAALTGLEGADGALTGDVTLDTHVGDVVGLIESHDLRDVVLVGHSYAGMVITGVAERAPARIGGLFYADAFVPENGQCALQFLPEAMQQLFRTQAAGEPDGFRLRASERQLDLWGLKSGPAREFVRARLCDFSIRCFEQPLRAPAGNAARLPRAYLACVADGYPARAAFAQFARRAQAGGWSYFELPTGHDCHVELPEAFCRCLEQARSLAGAQSAGVPSQESER